MERCVFQVIRQQLFHCRGTQRLHCVEKESPLFITSSSLQSTSLTSFPVSTSSVLPSPVKILSFCFSGLCACVAFTWCFRQSYWTWWSDEKHICVIVFPTNTHMDLWTTQFLVIPSKFTTHVKHSPWSVVPNKAHNSVTLSPPDCKGRVKDMKGEWLFLTVEWLT